MLEVSPTVLELLVRWRSVISENSRHYLGNFPRDKERERRRTECIMLIGATQGKKGELHGCSANRKGIPEPSDRSEVKSKIS